MPAGMRPNAHHSIAPSPANMRSVMGRFATGVTVVTSIDDAGPVGFTCQSFASVSLEPPLVLFCADHRSRTWPRIRAVGRFCVNVLSESQVDVCGRFGSRDGRKFEELKWEVSPWDTPVLPDVLARVHADIDVIHPAGDHDVVVGRVLRLDTGNDDESPMVFHRGKIGLAEQNPLPR